MSTRRTAPAQPPAPAGPVQAADAGRRVPGREPRAIRGRARPRPKHRGDVRLERVEIGRQEIGRDAERPADRHRLRVIARPLVAGERLEPGVIRGNRRVDQRGVDPERKVRITSGVAGALDRSVEPVQPADLRPRRRRRSVDDRQVASKGPLEAAPRVGPEVAVLIDPGCDQRVGELEEQRARAGSEEKHRLAIQSPRFARRPVESLDLRRCQRTRRQAIASVRPIAARRSTRPRGTPLRRGAA